MLLLLATKNFFLTLNKLNVNPCKMSTPKMSTPQIKTKVTLVHLHSQQILSVACVSAPCGVCVWCFF